MKKEILCVMGTAALAVCSVITSSQPKVEAKAAITRMERAENTVCKEHFLSQSEVVPYAGIFAETLEPSFTTESGDCIAVEKREVTTVGLANEEENSDENRWGIQLTEEEIELLAKIVWVEARGESEAGQKAVVEVVFNRIASDLFPNTLYEVLSQKEPVQFSSFPLRDTAVPTEKEYHAIYEVLNGQTNLLRADTMYFATTKLGTELDIKIGGHYFCY